MRNVDLGMNYSTTTVAGASPSSQIQSQSQAPIQSQTKSQIQSPQQQADSEKEIPKDKKELNSDEAQQLTVEMNKFMQLLNADIKFVLHEKTKTLIVQVVDSKENKVLKEFPPHEMLDIKAKIREHIGALLDKRV